MVRGDPVIGMSVLKEFPTHGYFSGTVVSSSGVTYRIRYTDGDCEEATRAQVIELLMPQANCVFCSVKLSGDGSRVVPKYFITHREELVVRACSAHRARAQGFVRTWTENTPL